jgi:cytochrome c-type biogenesis protein CcmH/NrfF
LPTVACVLVLAYLPPLQLMSIIAWPNHYLMLFPMSVLLVAVVVLLRRDERVQLERTAQTQPQSA